MRRNYVRVVDAHLVKAAESISWSQIAELSSTILQLIDH